MLFFASQLVYNLKNSSLKRFLSVWTEFVASLFILLSTFVSWTGLFFLILVSLSAFTLDFVQKCSIPEETFDPISFVFTPYFFFFFFFYLGYWHISNGQMRKVEIIDLSFQKWTFMFKLFIAFNFQLWMWNNAFP